MIEPRARADDFSFEDGDTCFEFGCRKPIEVCARGAREKIVGPGDRNTVVGVHVQRVAPCSPQVNKARGRLCSL